MYGCKYLQMNMKRLEEVCTITGEVRRGEVLCDFDFENCPHYQARQFVDDVSSPRNITPVFDPGNSLRKEKSEQTSIFDYENNF